MDMGYRMGEGMSMNGAFIFFFLNLRIPLSGGFKEGKVGVREGTMSRDYCRRGCIIAYVEFPFSGRGTERWKSQDKVKFVSK